MGIRNLIYMEKMALKSRHSRESLVTAAIAKITNHLEVSVRSGLIRTRLLRLIGSPSLQAVQKVSIYHNSNASVKMTFDQMRFTNGSPLPLGGQLCWPLQLCPFHKISLAR